MNEQELVKKIRDTLDELSTLVFQAENRGLVCQLRIQECGVKPRFWMTIQKLVDL